MHVGRVGCDHEGRRIELIDDLDQLIVLVLRDHAQQHVLGLMRIAAGRFHDRRAAAEPRLHCIRDLLVLGRDDLHGLGYRALGRQHPVDAVGCRKYGQEADQHGRQVISRQAQQHREGVREQHQHADLDPGQLVHDQRRHVHAAGAGAGAHDQADADAADQAAVEGGQERLNAELHVPDPDHIHEDRIADGRQEGVDGEFPAQHRPSQEKKHHDQNVGHQRRIDVDERFNGDRDAGDAAGQDIVRQNENLHRQSEQEGAEQNQKCVDDKLLFVFHRDLRTPL